MLIWNGLHLPEPLQRILKENLAPPPKKNQSPMCRKTQYRENVHQVYPYTRFPIYQVSHFPVK